MHSKILTTLWTIAILAPLATESAQAQVFENLSALSNRVRVGDPSVHGAVSKEGPKDLVTADFDGDGKPDLATSNGDGTVSIAYGAGGTEFEDVTHLKTGGATLREILAVDSEGNTLPEIVTADPVSGKIFYFTNRGGRSFSEAAEIITWPGARNMVADDFDGDGHQDIAVAGINVGLRLLKGDGDGGFTALGEDITELNPSPATAVSTPYGSKPIYTLRTFRPGGSVLPKLLATHADTKTFWILELADNGSLAISHRLFSEEKESSPDLGVHNFAIASVTRPLSSGVPDLVTTNKYNNFVTVWRGKSEAPYFMETPDQELPVSSGPRAIAVADLTGDGWGEIAVVSRENNHVAIFANDSGTLTPSGKIPVGSSPREIVLSDVDMDGLPDIIVSNRVSSDVSIVLSDAELDAGFEVPTQIYTTDGEVEGLAVTDLDQDGQDDVIQLHSLSGDISVRLARDDGSLSRPKYFPMGVLPVQLSVSDLNEDGFVDVITANLGRGMLGGSIAVRLGDGMGGFGEVTMTRATDASAPAGSPPGIFSVVTADFDNDGTLDRAVGYFDCRITFFRGLEDGTFEQLKTHFFLYESRIMVTGDFDQDGDTDILGANRLGSVVVIENKGDLLTTEELCRFELPGNGDKIGLTGGEIRDLNSDGDPDFFFGTKEGFFIFIGQEGVAFNALGIPINTNGKVSALAQGDFDQNGTQDLAASCEAESSLSIFTIDAQGEFEPVLTVPVPAAAFITSGDIDGDGEDDLVGTGTSLWVALSGANPTRENTREGNLRPLLDQVVINEVLAINDNVPVPADGGRHTDMVELFNGRDQSVDVSGWTLTLQVLETTESRGFLIPEGTTIGSGQRLVVIYSKNLRSPLHTGYKLPGSGATLTLTDNTGTVTDSVSYPNQSRDVSFARFRDGIDSFSFNPFPDPGRENLDNGALEPDVKLLRSLPEIPEPGEPIWFFVEAEDDFGIETCTVEYRRLDLPGATPQIVPVFDDGMHDDGVALDGLFAGSIPEGLPGGAEIEFFIRAIDLTGEECITPDNDLFSPEGFPLRNFSLVVRAEGQPTPPIQISEIAPRNSGFILDENGQSEDWIEIRNTGTETVDLGGQRLAQSPFADVKDQFTFPEGTVLNPGAYLIVWADDDTEDGPLHAPFKISASAGETLFFLDRTTLGATRTSDFLTVPAVDGFDSYGRLGQPGLERALPPTPGSQNLVQDLLPLLLQEDGQNVFTLIYRSELGKMHIVESTDDLSADKWELVQTHPGDNVEKTLVTPVEGRRFFRVKRF